jgi:cytochrome c-type biogenesis protein
MTSGWVDYLTGPYGFAFAFAAGILSFLSPCVLPLVPAYLAHLTGTAATLEPGRVDRRETVAHAVAFVAGFTAVFTFIGASAGLIGALVSRDSSYVVRDNTALLAKIGGVFLIVMGLNLIGVIRIPWLYRTYTLETATAGGGGRVSGQAEQATGVPGGGNIAIGGRGGAWHGLTYAKSAGVGSAFAVGWTPCIGPVLGAILTLSASSSSVAKGAYLLLVYSLGLGVPFILTGLAVVPVTRFLRSVRGLMPLVEILTGVLVIFVGVLLFFNELTIFNTYFSDIPFLDKFNSI